MEFLGTLRYTQLQDCYQRLIVAAMKDVVSLNRMYLLTAQRVARSGEGNLGSMVTGMPDHLLQKIANMSLEEIDKVANATPITFFTMRLDEDSMKQVLDSPTNSVGALSVSALALSGR